MSEVIAINQRRKTYWPANAIRYYLGKLTRSRRNKRLWIFSAWEGMKYADNSKYLFEYILDNHPEIMCFWQTKDPELFRKLTMKGVPVQLIGSKESRITQKKAGVAIYTNGVDDFGNVPYIYGAQLVCLWHGASFKKPYRLQIKEDRNVIRKILGNMKWDIFNYLKQDITIATSDYCVNFFKRGFRLKKDDRICKAGQARNDGFNREMSINKNLLDYCNGKKVIVYMPTFRTDNSGLIKEIEFIFSSREIQDMLVSNNCVLLCKLHYLCHANVLSNRTCLLLKDEDVQDVQQLQLLADMLITDYSGSGIDYALLGRPILFFFPDWEEYHADETMMPETREICGVNVAWSRYELIPRLNEMIVNPQMGLRQSMKLNEYFNSENIPIGSFCKKNYEEISRLI